MSAKARGKMKESSEQKNKGKLELYKFLVMLKHRLYSGERSMKV